jgi:hypothetical protein
MVTITTQPIGIDRGFLKVFADGQHIGYLTECPVLGWEAHLGTEYSESRKIGAAYRLDRAKQFFVDRAAA